VNEGRPFSRQGAFYAVQEHAKRNSWHRRVGSGASFFAEYVLPVLKRLFLGTHTEVQRSCVRNMYVRRQGDSIKRTFPSRCGSVCRAIRGTTRWDGGEGEWAHDFIRGQSPFAG